MKHVFVVKKNADLTEGRGPMLTHAVFDNGPEAVRYVEAQNGISGPRKIDMNKYGSYAYGNGYQIDEYPLYSNAAELGVADENKVRKQALAKLSGAEKKALGLE